MPAHTDPAKNRYDVLIVGLGPTGITLAALLAQHGLTVAAFDKLPDLYPLPRAVGMDHEAMRIMQQLGLAQALEPHIAPYRPSEYRGADGQPIMRVDAAAPPHPLGWMPNYVFNQPALEHTLRAHVAADPRVLMRVDTEVVDVGQTDDGAWVDARGAGDAAATRFTGSYLVACDGGASPIRKKLGIPLEDLGFDEAWLVIDSIVPPDKIGQLPQTQVQYCDPARPATFVVGPGNHRRWEIMLQPGDSASTPFPEDELWKLLERWVRPGEITLWRSAAYRFHGLVAARWRAGRILLAGDAAHMTPPFMAQGMMQGLRDALNLSWKLARVIGAQAHHSLLDSYEQERRPHTVATTLAAIELGRIICERDPCKAAERDARLRAKHGGEIKTTVRQNLIPGLSAGLVDTQRPAHGQLFPQPYLSRPRPHVLLDELTGPAFRLVMLDLPSPRMQSRLLAALAALDGVMIHLGPGAAAPSVLCVEEAGAVIEPWMRKLGVRHVLARPDHYVYGASHDAEDALHMLHELHQRVRCFGRGQEAA